MEKIIDTAALTDQLKILLWDRSKSREELAELVVKAIKEAGREIVRCKDCVYNETDQCMCGESSAVNYDPDYFCRDGERRDSDG